MFPVKSVYPIILPCKQFTDNLGKANAFIDMNPSMSVDANGNCTVLVRSVNYRKFPDKQFSLYQNQSNSVYTILRGKIAESLNLETFKMQQLQYQYGLPTYPTYWKGLEDIRFVDPHTVLATIPECNPRGNPSIFRAILQGAILHSFSPCKPDEVEKNWMPFANEKVIYSLNPLKIKNIETEYFETLEISDVLKTNLENYHGSTNGIPYEGGYLFLIHVNKERTYHRWFWLNLADKSVKVSEPFVFFSHSYIEFPCSLCMYKNRIFVSLGINDDKAAILELDPAHISLS